MPREIEDQALLLDMLDSARAVREMVTGMDFRSYSADRRTRRAVEREVEIIGEAARRVSPETRENQPDIPWKSIIGLRNVLAHEYGEVRYEILWTIISNRLAPLIKQLEGMGVDNTPQVEVH